mmetsp:Transcript_13415/g.44193  ORF Transcript_13415/g.44193 Transcript_13415/m.44193 type:complete len:870 (+) Transcript_13415:164-2773(+)
MEDKINLNELMLLKQRFQEADDDGSGGIELDEFVSSFGSLLGDHLTEMQLAHLFMKIDADSNGSVDWDEFTNFMFLEKATEKADPGEDWRYIRQDFADPNTDPLSVHRDICERVQYLPAADKYITAGRDGTFRLWNAADLQHSRTIHNSSSWITDFVYMPLQRKLAFSSTDRSISFYDINRNSFDLVGRIYTAGQMGVPHCLSVAIVHDQDHVLYGDTKGTARLLMCGTRENGRNMRWDDTAVLHKEHKDWVTKVQYVPDLSAVVTSSLDGTVKVTDFNHRKVRLTCNLHKKGLYSFDWCRAYSLFASCGLERDIYLWHGGTGRKVGTLVGHSASVQDVVVDDSLNQLVSLSTDKCIKVWDLRNHKCIQTIIDEEVHRPENRITAIMYDAKRSRLVTATSKPTVWPHVCTTKMYTGHEHALCGALYNNNFGLVVSGDDSGCVSVWRIEDGERAGRFSNAHAESKLTALAFDTSGRRLLTAANDGSVKMWNFNNGQLLKTFTHKEEMLEVTTVLYISEGARDVRMVIAAGWNRKVIVWEDSEDTTISDYRVLSGHDEDILCATFHPPSLLATGDYNGQIVLWNTNSGLKRQVLHHKCDNEYERSCEKLVFFEAKSKMVDGQATLVSCGGDGLLRLWGSGPGGQHVLRHTQRGAHRGHAISAVFSDKNNAFLFVGDGDGHMRVLDVSQLDLTEEFTVSESLIQVGFWRAHRRGIASIDFMESRKLLVVSSLDTDISLWTLDGLLVGLFGQTKLWSLEQHESWLDPNKENRALPNESDAPAESNKEAAADEEEILEESDSSSDEEEEEVVQPASARVFERRMRARHNAFETNAKPQTVHSSLVLHDLKQVPGSVGELRTVLEHARGAVTARF